MTKSILLPIKYKLFLVHNNYNFLSANADLVTISVSIFYDKTYLEALLRND